MKPWLETVLSAIGSPSKNRFSPISTIFGFIKIDYETPPPFCPKPLFAQPRPEEPQEPQARHGAAQVDLQGLDSVPSIPFLRLSTFPSLDWHGDWTSWRWNAQPDYAVFRRENTALPLTKRLRENRFFEELPIALKTVSNHGFIGLFHWGMGFCSTEQNSMILSPYSPCLGRICHDIIMIR